MPRQVRPLVAHALELALRLSSRRAGVVLVYHGIAEHSGDPRRDVIPAHGAGLAEAQLLHIRRRYRVVAADELLDAIRRRRRGARFPVAITFDDDLRSHVDAAAPLLRRLGLPATFFLCGASLEQPFSFWWERLQRAVDAGVDLTAIGDGETPRALARQIEERPADARREVADELVRLAGEDQADSGLRAADVRALVEAGFSVGFHTLRHERLPPLTDDELAHALEDGRAALEAAAGRALTSIAYPHGHADGRVARAAEAAGFRLGFTGSDEAVKATADPLLLSRIQPSFRDVASLGAQLVRGLGRAHR